MLGNLMPAKDGLVILGRGLIKTKQNKKTVVQRIGEVASVDQWKADDLQDNMRKLLRSKYICLDKFYNTDESALFWEKVSCCCCFFSH